MHPHMAKNEDVPEKVRSAVQALFAKLSDTYGGQRGMARETRISQAQISTVAAGKGLPGISGLLILRDMRSESLDSLLALDPPKDTLTYAKSLARDAGVAERTIARFQDDGKVATLPGWHNDTTQDG